MLREISRTTLYKAPQVAFAMHNALGNHFPAQRHYHCEEEDVPEQTPCPPDNSISMESHLLRACPGLGRSPPPEGDKPASIFVPRIRVRDVCFIGQKFDGPRHRRDPGISDKLPGFNTLRKKNVSEEKIGCRGGFYFSDLFIETIDKLLRK